jgi:hypothetical protein
VEAGACVGDLDADEGPKAGHRAGTRHVPPPGLQLAPVCLAHGGEQIAPGGIAPQSDFGPGGGFRPGKMSALFVRGERTTTSAGWLGACHRGGTQHTSGAALTRAGTAAGFWAVLGCGR